MPLDGGAPPEAAAVSPALWLDGLEVAVAPAELTELMNVEGAP